MTNQELATACQRAIGGHGRVNLVIPGSAPRGLRIRLDRRTRRKCSMGEILNWDAERGTLAQFEAIDVLAWMVARGMAQLL